MTLLEHRPPVAPGVATTSEQVRLQVSTLGLETARDLDLLPRPVTLPGPQVPGPACS